MHFWSGAINEGKVVVMEERLEMLSHMSMRQLGQIRVEG